MGCGWYEGEGMKGGKTNSIGDVVRVYFDCEFTDGVGGGDPSVEFCAGVVAGEPGGFAVVGHVAAAVVLFFTGVDDGDAIGEEDVAEDVFGFGVVGCVAVWLVRDQERGRGRGKGGILGEARVVVVFNEVAEEGWVGAVACHGFDHVVEVADAATGGFKGVEELPVTELEVSDVIGRLGGGSGIHGVVEHAVKILLVWTVEGGVPVVDFSDAVHAGCFLVAWEEIRLDLEGAVNAEAVDWDCQHGTSMSDQRSPTRVIGH